MILGLQIQALEERNSVFESEVIRLQAELDEAELEMESLKQNRSKQAEETRSQFVKMSSNFDKLQRDIDSSNAEKARLVEQIVELERDLDTLRQEKERLVKELDAISLVSQIVTYESMKLIYDEISS